jgi:anti-anti-sigma factor
MANPSPRRALDSTRVAREAAKLEVALRAVDHAYANLDQDPAIRDELAEESELLGRELALRGASLGALGLWLRAHALGRSQAQSVQRLLTNYPTWRPDAGSVGVPRDALKAAASGAFWIGLRRRARILVLEGGITGQGTEPFARILLTASEGVNWVFVDMAQVNYVGSAGLALAVKISERLRPRAGGVALFGLSANLKILVETLGLEKHLPPVEGLAGALALGSR